MLHYRYIQPSWWVHKVIPQLDNSTCPGNKQTYHPTQTVLYATKFTSPPPGIHYDITYSHRYWRTYRNFEHVLVSDYRPLEYFHFEHFPPLCCDVQELESFKIYSDSTTRKAKIEIFLLVHNTTQFWVWSNDEFRGKREVIKEKNRLLYEHQTRNFKTQSCKWHVSKI